MTIQMEKINTAIRLHENVQRNAVELIQTNLACEHGLLIHHIGLIGSRGRNQHNSMSDYDFCFVYSTAGRSAHKVREDMRFEVTMLDLPDGHKVEFVGTELKKYMREIADGSIYQLEWLVSFPFMGALSDYVIDIKDEAFDRTTAARILAHVEGLVRSVVDIPGRHRNIDKAKQYRLARHYLVALYSYIWKTCDVHNIFHSISDASYQITSKAIVEQFPHVFKLIDEAIETKDYSEVMAHAINQGIYRQPETKEVLRQGQEAAQQQRNEMGRSSAPYAPWGTNHKFSIFGPRTEFAKKLDLYPYL